MQELSRGKWYGRGSTAPDFGFPTLDSLAKLYSTLFAECFDYCTEARLQSCWSQHLIVPISAQRVNQTVSSSGVKVRLILVFCPCGAADARGCCLPPEARAPLLHVSKTTGN